MKPSYEELEQENFKLKELIKQAFERITELEKKLGRNSKNSSKPPSTDQKDNTPANMNRMQKKPHPGKSRNPYQQDQVDQHISCTRDLCPYCRLSNLKMLQETPFLWQQVELPEVQAMVTQFECLRYCCNECDKRSIGTLPEGVPFSAFGPKLMALIATLTGRFHMAKREAILLINDLYGIELSEGSIINIEEKVANALEGIYARIHRFVVQNATSTRAPPASSTSSNRAASSALLKAANRAKSWPSATPQPLRAPKPSSLLSMMKMDDFTIFPWEK